MIHDIVDQIQRLITFGLTIGLIVGLVHWVQP